MRALVAAMCFGLSLADDVQFAITGASLPSCAVLTATLSSGFAGQGVSITPSSMTCTVVSGGANVIVPPPSGTSASDFANQWGTGNAQVNDVLKTALSAQSVETSVYTGPASPSPPSPPPNPPGNPGGDGGDPCFPAKATVVLADGTSAHVDALKEGDLVLAAAADGSLTTDSVSLLSIAKHDAEATFLKMTTDAAKTITLTAEHHLAVGDTCCSTLAKAKDVRVGDKLWIVDGGNVAAPSNVVKIVATIERGLHSPVLAKGSFPVVDGVVTSFDSLIGVQINAALSPYLMPLIKTTGTADIVRRLFFGAQLKYIDGFEAKDPAIGRSSALSAFMAFADGEGAKHVSA